MVDVIDRGEIATKASTIRRAIRRKESRIKKLQQDLAEAEIRGGQQEIAQLTSQLEEARQRLVYQQSRLDEVVASAGLRNSLLLSHPKD